jgi:hypothetical protein
MTWKGFLALAGIALLAAAAGQRAVPASGGLAQATAAPVAQTEHIAALMNAVRGANALTCRLAARALENRWGGSYAGLPGPESIGAAEDAAFEWAVSGDVDAASIPPLRTALADNDGCVRRTAAVLLGHARLESLAAELRTELASASAGTRQAALMAIGHAGRPADLQAAARALDDPDPAVKLAAAWALGSIGDAAAVPPLVAALRDADPILRATAAISLGRTESSEAIPALVALLGSDSDPRVRRAAAAALGQIDR